MTPTQPNDAVSVGRIQPTLGRLNAIFEARKQAKPADRTPVTGNSLPQLMRLCRDLREPEARRSQAAEELRRRLKMRMRGKISESLTHATAQTLDDLTQTALVRLFNSKWTALETDTSERGYALLDTVCRSVVQDALRKAYGRGDASESQFTRRVIPTSLDNPVYANDDGVSQRDLIPDTAPPVWDVIAAQMQGETLRATLKNSLPDGEFAVIWLNFFEGLTLKEAADTLAITHEAARTRCSRALKRLRGHREFAALCAA